MMHHYVASVINKQFWYIHFPPVCSGQNLRVRGILFCPNGSWINFNYHMHAIIICGLYFLPHFGRLFLCFEGGFKINFCLNVWLVFVDKVCNKLVIKRGLWWPRTVVPHGKQQNLTTYCPIIYTVANNLWLLPYEWHFFYMARPLYFSHLAKNILEVIIFGNSILLVEPYNPL